MTRRTATRRTLTRRTVTGVAAVVLVVAACTSDDDAAAPSTVAPVTTAGAPARPSDGTLRIGVLLPQTGVGSQLGLPMLDAVELAADRINEAGGVLGRDVELIRQDEGDTETSAASALDTLLQADVDAIVGPASSLAALADLDAAVEAGVVTCSPTATALALDEFPDDGLFFRTVPSDSLQAQAIAATAEGTGARTVAIGNLDDPYGRGLADALTAAITASDLQIVTSVGFDGADEQLDDEAATLLADVPDVVVVLGDADDGSRLVGAIGELSAADERGDPPFVIVNDALRSAASQPVMQRLAPEVRTRVIGVAPLAITTADEELARPYAAHAYDCVTLLALAAAQSGSDDPIRIAQQMPLVSVGGRQCSTFEECLDALANDELINYEGPSGNTDLSSRTGDPLSGRFERFAFSDDGLDRSSGESFVVSTR